MARSKTKPIRVQFDFAPNALARLNELVDKTEATSRADVIRNALRLYEWLTDKALEGKSISLNGGSEVEGPIDLTLITGAAPQPDDADSSQDGS